MTAVYDIPGQSGANVTLNVTGTIQDPRITFTSTETQDQAEIIALLVSGRRRLGGGSAGHGAPA